MSKVLTDTLGLVAAAAANSRDHWWIIGSAAVALHRRAVPDIQDVDVLMSARDARAFLRGVGVEPHAGEPSRHFRSEVFGVWEGPPIPVEVMGGFDVRLGDSWVPVWPCTRETVGTAGWNIFVPSACELAQLLRTFGRPKDLERASLLDV